MTHGTCEASMLFCSHAWNWTGDIIGSWRSSKPKRISSVPQYKNDSSRSPFWQRNADANVWDTFQRKQNYNWSARTNCNKDGSPWRHTPWMFCREAAVSSKERQSGNLARLRLHIRPKQKEAKHRHTGTQVHLGGLFCQVVTENLLRLAKSKSTCSTDVRVRQQEEALSAVQVIRIIPAAILIVVAVVVVTDVDQVPIPRGWIMFFVLTVLHHVLLHGRSL